MTTSTAASRWPFLTDLLGHPRDRPRHHPGLFDAAALFGWDDLNDILAHQHLQAPQLQLAHDGRYLAPHTYTHPLTLRPGTVQDRLDPARLYQLMRHATLVLDGVDHLHPRTRAFAAAIEPVLATTVSLTAYASLGADPSFGRHWDDHAVLVLQIEGTKRWEIQPPTLTDPTAAVRHHAPPPTHGTEAIDLDLRPGDALFVPRGWWHLVTARRGPSLHLTCALTPHTGLDLITWLATDPDLAALRADLPAPGDPTAGGHLPTLLAALEQALRDPHVLRRYNAATARTAPVRPALSLPHPHTDTLAPDTRVTLIATSARTRLTASGGSQLHAGGRDLPLHLLHIRLLEPLRHRDSATVGELATAAQLAPAKAGHLLATLLHQGIVAVPTHPRRSW